jgi:CRP-like cAMP-binding protein
VQCHEKNHRPSNEKGEKLMIKQNLSLASEPFFMGMSESALRQVEGLVYHREYEPRQIIHFPEDPCDHVFWVREGRVKVTRVSGDGRELTFRHLLPGDMLGEECLVHREKRSDYAESMGVTVLCLMRAEDFSRLYSQILELSNRVTMHLCRRTIELENVLSDTVFNSVRRRVASGLLRLYRKERNVQGDFLGNGGTLRVTHQEVANLIGSTRETTTSVLHALREAGILQMANRRLTVLDSAALAHLAGRS